MSVQRYVRYCCVTRLLQSGVEIVLKKIGHEQSGGQIVKSKEVFYNALLLDKFKQLQSSQLIKEALAIRRIFSLVDTITKPKFPYCPNVFKLGMFR